MGWVDGVKPFQPAAMARLIATECACMSCWRPCVQNFFVNGKLVSKGRPPPTALTWRPHRGQSQRCSKANSYQSGQVCLSLIWDKHNVVAGGNFTHLCGHFWGGDVTALAWMASEMTAAGLTTPLSASSMESFQNNRSRHPPASPPSPTDNDTHADKAKSLYACHESNLMGR